MAEREIIDLQLDAAAIQPTGTALVTSPLLPPSSATDRMRHFPEEVYNLSPDSHLSRFVKTLLGDAGAGQLRKRFVVARLQQTLQSTHFYNLDRFYGALFGVRRTLEERLDLDPSRDLATTSEWNIQHAKDASYRSRIVQFSRAISYGATPTGMELVAEALLSVDCDIFESYIQADSSYQTYGEIEAQYPTYADLEGVSYGTLEGSGLSRMAGDDRREFIIRPKRPISAAEAYEVGRVLQRLKPADTRFRFTEGSQVYLPVEIRLAVADSNYWEITSTVIPISGRSKFYLDAPAENGPLAAPAPGQTPPALPPVEPIEQPRPPLTTNQTAAWSYLDAVMSATAVSRVGDTYQPMPIFRQPVGTSLVEYLPLDALQSRGRVFSGRMVSDGILTYHPLSSDPTQVYVDCFRAETLARASNVASRDDRWWVTPARRAIDPTQEILEVTLTGDSLVNRLDLEFSRLPCTIEVFSAQTGDAAEDWTLVHSVQVVFDAQQWNNFASGPYYRTNPTSIPQAWEPISLALPSTLMGRVRLVLTRHSEVAGMQGVTQTWGPFAKPYSLSVRNLNLGFRAASRQALTLPRNQPIAHTRDVLGSRVEWSLHEEVANDIFDTQNVWRCEPQPVNYAVVNFYLDVRKGDGGPEVIDRFFMDPTHPGVHMAVYYTNDPGEPSADDTDWYNGATWTPIARDYTLQRGYVSIPPTSARHFKFEFTNLTPEPYDSLLPVLRKVRLLPRQLHQAQTNGLSDEAAPAGVAAAETLAAPSYSDAIEGLARTTRDFNEYSPTEAVVLTDPAKAAEIHRESWVFGFQPWSQGGPAPRFVEAGVHDYEVVEVVHTTKIAYMVGLNDIRAFRVNFGADDDSQVYVEHFHDFAQIEPGFTWTFNSNALTTETSSAASATSQVYSSLHNVKAVQFATQQTQAIQVVYDDDFRDPANAVRDWTDTEGWHKVGDALLAYNPGSHSITLQRFAEPVEGAPTTLPGAIVERPIHPVFVARAQAYVDNSATFGQFGGVESMPLPVSTAGRVHSAVRLTLRTALTHPLYLQILNGTGDVVASKAIIGGAGETIETFLTYDLAGESVLRTRLVQYGPSDDRWEVDTLSVFDEGIVWEFSNNGGGTWIVANNVRNNEHGILTFPEPGNQLRWRVRGLRQRMAVSSLKIRPHYVGEQNSRLNAAQRGANVSVYDADIPIQSDPMFTDWHQPVPKGWFAAYKRLPSASLTGAPNVTEFARFYGRPVGETIPTSTDATGRTVLARRTGTDWPDGVPFRLDSVSRAGSVYRRSVGDTAAASDSAQGTWLATYSDRIVNRTIHPV